MASCDGGDEKDLQVVGESKEYCLAWQSQVLKVFESVALVFYD